MATGPRRPLPWVRPIAYRAPAALNNEPAGGDAERRSKGEATMSDTTPDAIAAALWDAMKEGRHMRREWMG